METRRVTVVGSVLAASAASTCCIGPLVALVLGVASAEATSTLQKWRPIFLAVTFVLLGLAWYLTYRKPKAEGCGDGAACPAKRNAKGGKVILWAGTVLAFALSAVPLYAGMVARLLHQEDTRPARVVGANMAILRVKIPSMNCAACAVNIERSLMKENGIVRAEVVFKTKLAVIEYDSAKISPEKVVSAVDKTGFTAEPITGLRKQ